MLNKKQIISVSVVVLAVIAVLIFVSGKAGGRDNPKASENPSQKTVDSQKTTDNSSHKSTKSQSTMQNDKSASTTPSAEGYVPKINGVTIEVLKAGSGDKVVKSGDTISVHYTGTLEDGTVFDSSIPRKQPFSFSIGQGEVIRGWDEGLIGMKVGEKRKLTISPEMGYGAQANGPIPANSFLIFETELMGIE